jgi:hypothetical protein
MTLSALEQLKEYKNYQISKEVWYNKFPYRIGLTGYWKTDNGRIGLANDNIIEMQRRLRKFMKKSAGIEYRIRSDTYFNVYLKTADDVFKIANEVGWNFVEHITGPMSEKQQDTMLADINVIYKNKLYYNLYRYKVDIVCYRSEGMDFIDNFRDFITENFEEGSYKFSNGFSSYDYYFKSSSASPVSIFGSIYVPWRIAASVYLKNYEDLCTIHMIYKNDICKTTKVALFSEA